MTKFIGNELKYVSEVLESDMKSATSGSFTDRLEKTFAKKFGRHYGIAHNSGTSALHTCLLAAGVRKGDEVISPALTVMMDTFATLYVQAIPVYADVNPKTFTIDPEEVKKKITKKTKAIIAVHLYGLPADMNPIMELAEENDITVIEDSAQCYLSRYGYKLAGSIGHLACFSFENSKHISVGEGGMVLTDDEELGELVRKYGGLGFKNLTASSGKVKLDENIFQSPDFKRHDTVGYNYRLPELNSAVALAQLERLEELVAKRQAVASFYKEAIEGCDWLVPQETPKGYSNSYWTFAMQYEGVFGKSWHDIRSAYIKHGGDGFYAAWSVPYLEPAHEHAPVFVKCHVAENLQAKMMQLKTNYHDTGTAKQKAEALRKAIEELK